MEEQIRKVVEDALRSVGAGDVAFAVEWPADLTHGDFAVNAAMVAASKLKKNPRELAELLVPHIEEGLGDRVSNVSVAGAGFVNITLAPGTIREQLAAAQNPAWGKGTERAGVRTIIEYANPNPFKEMHIGHMMGAIIGESVSRLIENQGATLARDTFGGDVGPHVAKALWALRKNGITDIGSPAEIGAAYVEGAKAYEENEHAKKEIDALNKKIYAVVEGNGHTTFGDEDRELFTLWQKGREVSMEEFRRLYKLLGSKFDYEFYDSDTTETGMRLVREGLEKGVFEKSDGAIVYKGEKKGLHTRVFITSHDTPTYEAKDIGLAFLKEERFPSDVSIIITANEQTPHFKVFLAALEDFAPVLAGKMEHLAHGFLRLPSGKMSSREGNILTAATLIHDVTRRTLERNEDPLIAEQVAIAAIKYSILKQGAGSDIIFDVEKSLSLEGDSGPYLQYALVRAKAVLAKPSESKDESVPNAPYDIERLLIRFPEIAKKAEALRAPHVLAQYLTKLASEWNSFYAAERIVGGENESYKRTLAKTFVTTMENGLWLLGISAPEKM